MSGRRIVRSRWWLFAGWIVVIFGVSSIPDLGPPSVELPWTDKIAHLCEYGILGLLYARAGVHTAPTWRRALGGAITGALVGGLDELYQRTIPGRDSSGLDLVADAIGAGLGAIAWGRVVGLRPARGARPTSQSREGRA
jgi:VanZ family protein